MNRKGHYKYLWILELDFMKQDEMKEYLRIEIRLCSGNPIKDINSWALTIVRYFEHFLDWTNDELKSIN